MDDSEQKTPKSRLAVSILTLLIGGIGVLGFFYITGQHRVFDAEVRLRLGAAARMKAMQVAAWRSERIGDARAMAAAIQLMPAAQRVLRGLASPEERRQTTAWLRLVRGQYLYENVTLTDRRGEILLSAGALPSNPEYYRLLATEATRAADVVFDDFTREGIHAAPDLGVNIALKTAQGELLGALLLDIDPAHYLFPTLLDWPGAGRTGEVQLVRREGDYALFLNNTRLRPNASLNIRKSAALANSPAALAVKGGTDRIDGVDYRGVPVVAAARPVPGSDWFVVAKIDRAEEFAAADSNNIQLILLLVLLALSVSSLVGLFVHRQRERLYKDKYAAERERKILLERYEALTRFASDAILVWDHSGRVLEVNDRALQMFGYTREELVSMTIPGLKPVPEAGKVQQVQEHIEAAKSIVVETRHLRKDGSSFPSELSAGLIELEGMRLFQGIIRDISGRKLAERQIIRANHLYAVLSRCNAAIVRAQSEAALFQDVCKVVVEAGGFHIGWIGKVEHDKSVSAIARAGAGAAYLDEIKISVADGPLSAGPTGTCIREGRTIAVADIASDDRMLPWREPAARHGLCSSICLPLKRRGQTIYCLGMYSSEAGFFQGEEVTLAEEIGASLSFALNRLDLEQEREQVERERRLSQERLELAMDASNEGYWDWNADTDEWYISPRFYTMLGYQPGELKVDRLAMLEMTHPEDRPGVELAQDNLIQRGEAAYSVEFRVRHKDGHYIWVIGRAKLVARDETGRARRIVGTRIDITERKLLEQQFIQAQKLESIGRLAGGVAHDFNNMLSVINGYSQLMLKTMRKDDPLWEGVEEIFKAGERAAALTRQLLAFSRKQVLQPRVFDFNDAVQDIRPMLARLVGDNVDIKVRFHSGAMPVYADSHQLEQVVMNLVVNARDAMPRGGKIIIETADFEKEEMPASAGEVVTAVMTRPGRYNLLSVSDSGVGMDEETLKHIFEPFFTTKEAGKGTGLGLAVVHGIMEQSGGFMEIESEPGRGTTFRVFFPRSASAALAEEQEQGGTEPRGKETVLVVDDKAEVRKVAVAALKDYGYRVISAGSAAEAWAECELEQMNIDLLVTDLIMPNEGGLELAERVRKRWPETKILFMSGQVDDTVVFHSLIDGYTEFIQKPFLPAELATRVRKMLDEEVAER